MFHKNKVLFMTKTFDIFYVENCILEIFCQVRTYALETRALFAKAKKTR
jgi:hypothetical protein